ncbi:uncharacterized protein LOC143202605 [Rhynchophorus ferrugineus]|uniref:Golgi integral membrane protein 4 n=1 Tax=Rhynchophorus ferrugineus TaxID=354439 RepID=A0A834HW18_RHYFE|nr:hypothetical protein GWI33_018872 [Rhynchophorus ferrugineus]
MSSSRVIRSTKAKIFVYVCAILIITGLIACYNNTLSQLDDVKKISDICHQQHENLSTQLQVISEFKQKLEKVMKNEIAMHQKNVASLETKINEEKSKSEKASSDAQLKYNSLQQHFNLLKTEHEDFKEECSKIQKEQLDEVNSLQSKLKEIKEELKKVRESREDLKTRFTEIESENQKLKLNLNKKDPNAEAQETINIFSNKFHDLEDKYNALQQKCNENTQNKPEIITSVNNKTSEKSISSLPLFKGAEQPSSSTKSGAVVSPQSGNLNGAKPLHSPNITPESAKKEANLKPPQGVPAVPVNRESQNEQPEIQNKEKEEKDIQENAAQEVMDQSQGNVFDDLALEGGKLGNKKNEDANLHYYEDDDDDADHPRQADVIVRH